MHKPRHTQDLVLKNLSRVLPYDALSALKIEGVHVVQALSTECAKIDMKQSFADVVFEVDAGASCTLNFNPFKNQMCITFCAAIAYFMRPILYLFVLLFCTLLE